MKPSRLSRKTVFRFWFFALFIPLFAPAQTNTNLNAVAFINLAIPPGFLLVALPLLELANDLNSGLTNVPEGAVFYEFDNATSGYVSSTNIDGVWTPIDAVLAPGGGGLLFLPDTTVPQKDFLVSFSGEIPQGSLSAHIPAGFSLESVPIPGTFALTNSLINFPVEEGRRFIGGTTTPASFSYRPMPEAASTRLERRCVSSRRRIVFSPPWHARRLDIHISARHSTRHATN
jgi:hypothetical protein